MDLIDARTRTSAAPSDDIEDLISRIRRKMEDYLGPGANNARRLKEVNAVAHLFILKYSAQLTSSDPLIGTDIHGH